MTDSIPTEKWQRALTGGRTAAKVGGQVMAYYAKRPFLSKDKKERAREQMSRQSGRMLFQGLSLLKGTALKMAQQLSLEMDLLPEAACQELSKAYHQVPPINRALVRKVVRDGLGGPPEQFFTAFDLNAYAAASLGQVHRASGIGNRPLAVKIQYPGIAKTIESDVSLLRQLLKPMVPQDHLMPALAEVAARLHEEVDYAQEANNIVYFSQALTQEGVRIPDVIPELTSPTILSTAFMPGSPLDIWLRTRPSQKHRDLVANRLNSIFLQGLYDLNAIHADPNPGNFIIDEDLSIGLVDFGCVKRLPQVFVEQYRMLSKTCAHQQTEEHFHHMMEIGIFSGDIDGDITAQFKEISDAFAEWFGRLFAEEVFDFGSNADFIAQGKQVMKRMQRLGKYVNLNSDFIFLDRTRYGLLRLYEKMGARISFRNPYEW